MAPYLHPRPSTWQNRFVLDRELPPELVAALRRAAEVERAARNWTQRHHAIGATTRLMLACVEAGWRLKEVAEALGLKRSAAQERVKSARDRGVTAEGLEVPAAPRYPQSRAEQLAAPVDEREWLTANEAAKLAGVGKSTPPRWQRLGLLPHTLYAGRPRPLYLRADILRLMAAPRASNGGIDPAAAAEQIASKT